MKYNTDWQMTNPNNPRMVISQETREYTTVLSEKEAITIARDLLRYAQVTNTGEVYMFSPSLEIKVVRDVRGINVDVLIGKIEGALYDYDKGMRTISVRVGSVGAFRVDADYPIWIMVGYWLEKITSALSLIDRDFIAPGEDDVKQAIILHIEGRIQVLQAALDADGFEDVKPNLRADIRRLEREKECYRKGRTLLRNYTVNS